MIDKNDDEIDLFDFLNDINYYKKGDLLNSTTESEFKPYIILRFLADSEPLLPIVNHLNKLQSVLTKEQMYQLLIDLVPKRKRYLKFRGKDKDKRETEDIDRLIADHYDISIKCAKEYADLLTQEEKEEFKRSFGGKE